MNTKTTSAPAGKLAHTPKPWSKIKKEAGYAIFAKGKRIADVWSCDDEDTEANARLIAAAPELLTLLDDALGHLECVTADEFARCNRIMDVLRKVKGGAA